MNKKILSLLGVASVAVGMTTGATSAQASYLSPGVLSVETDGGIFFSNNAVDFTAFSTATPNPGQVGTGTVTTPVNGVIDSGVFGVVPGTPSTYLSVPNIDEIIRKLTIDGTAPLPDKRRFPGSQGTPDVPDFLSDIRIEDFEINFDEDNNGSPDRVLNNIVYTLPDAIPYLHFDTDGDDTFGDGSYGNFSAVLTTDENGDPIGNEVDDNDFTYYITTFERRVVPGEQPGVFNVIFDFDGFFRDGAGQFKDTPSQFSLFNGVTGVDPETLGITDNYIPQGNFEFQAGGDGRVGTAIIRQVPEPGTIIGLTALAGFGLASRLKRKAK